LVGQILAGRVFRDQERIDGILSITNRAQQHGSVGVHSQQQHMYDIMAASIIGEDMSSIHSFARDKAIIFVE
jgi:hypothetical protein